MTLRGTIELVPSRLARRVERGAACAVPALLLALALSRGHPWPLYWLPALALLAWRTRGAWDRVRRLERTPAGLRVDLGDGTWREAAVRGPARRFSRAVFVPCRLADGERLWVVCWRDAVDDATFRRLSRVARSGRWAVGSRRPRRSGGGDRALRALPTGREG
jgi:hypothetical protein